MSTLYVGPFEIHNGSIGTTEHSGRGGGWEFSATWRPGDSDEKLKEVLESCIKYGKEERSKEIGKLLGVSK
jgi:hypothetical protein